MAPHWGAVSRKLLYTIYAALKENKPYVVQLDTIQ